VVGMVVDGVSDVINLSSEQIKPAPEFGTALDTDYLTGLGTLDQRMLILIDIDKFIASLSLEITEQSAA
jgi:purine-binding chemotaxis protein CheW